MAISTGSPSTPPRDTSNRVFAHPVLVISPEAFNEATQLLVILPITNGGEFVRRIGFAVPISGIRTTGVVRCDQPRVLDLHERKGQKIDTLPQEILDEVLAKVGTIFL